MMGKAFYEAHKSAISTLEEIEKAIIGGNTSKDLEKDDW